MTLGRRFPNNSKMITPMMSISIGPGMPKKTARGRDTAETSGIEIIRVARGDTPTVSVGVKIHYIAAIRAVKLPFALLEARLLAGEAFARIGRKPQTMGAEGPRRQGSRSKACSQ